MPLVDLDQGLDGLDGGMTLVRLVCSRWSTLVLDGKFEFFIFVVQVVITIAIISFRFLFNFHDFIKVLKVMHAPRQNRAPYILLLAWLDEIYSIRLLAHVARLLLPSP